MTFDKEDEGHAKFRSSDEEEEFVEVLEEAIGIIEDEKIAYVVIGGIPSVVLGLPRSTNDVDIYVKPEDADRAIRALHAAGFETEKPQLDWLYKAVKNNVLVDIIFRTTGDIYLDDEMVERALSSEYKGVQMKLVPPEDLVVMKAVAHSEETSQYWQDALTIMASATMDWDYLLRRARFGARRMLSLLIYAESIDRVVPEKVIRSLFEDIYG